jgi:hypothetical protein
LIKRRHEFPLRDKNQKMWSNPQLPEPKRQARKNFRVLYSGREPRVPFSGREH